MKIDEFTNNFNDFKQWLIFRNWLNAGMGQTLEVTLHGLYWTTLSGKMVSVSDLGFSTLILKMALLAYQNPLLPGLRSSSGTQKEATIL